MSCREGLQVDWLGEMAADLAGRNGLLLIGLIHVAGPHTAVLAIFFNACTTHRCHCPLFCSFQLMDI